MATKTVVNGRVFDEKTNIPLPGTKVRLGKKRATTDANGTFSIELILKEGETPPNRVIFKKSGYAPKRVSAITQSGNLKQKINATPLKPLNFDFGIQIPQLIVFGAAQLRGLKGRGTSPEGKAIEGALNESNKIYERLIPFALKQLSKFGIQDPADEDLVDCPAITDINSVITENNKTTRQLNNSFKTINSLSKAAKILRALLQAIKVVLQLMKKNPTPTAVGVPPGPAGGLLPPPLTKTMGGVTSYDEKREKTQKKIERFEELLSVFPDAVQPISLAVGQATSIIKTTDNLVGNCLDQARQQVVDEINRQQGLTSTTTLSSVIGSNGNTFTVPILQGLISRGESYDVVNQNGLTTSGSIAINTLNSNELLTVVEPNGNQFEIQGGQFDQSGIGQNGLNTQGGNLSVTDADFTEIDDNLLKDILGIDRDTDIQIGDLLAGNYLQEQLDAELTALTEDAAGDGQPSVTEYNGFILSVETETEEQAAGKSIKRRFAVGKNKDGVTLVQGEKSYSSNDQILLDELIFKIETEELSVN
jgi:hypothetical protein